MKNLIILIILLGVSCKSTNDTQSSTSKDDKYLLSLSKEKTITSDKEQITTYKNTSLKKVVNTEKGDFKFYFGSEIIFEGTKECLFLLELFNNTTLLLSTSDTPENISVAGPENFIRGKILLIDKETGSIKVADFQEGIFLKSHKGNLNTASRMKNVFVINNVNYNKSVMKLEDTSGVYKEVSLIEMESTPFKCN